MTKPERPQREKLPTQDPNLSIVICDDGSRTLKCETRDVTWHSESGALAESQLVFLENGGVSDLLTSNETTRVFEVGFGTGLNFWLTASMALKNGAALDYVSIEPSLLPEEILQGLQYADMECCSLAVTIFSASFGRQEHDSVTLELIEQRLSDADLGKFRDCFDAVYHDPFSPEAAPELWTTSVFEQLHAILRPAGRLVTYCVKSEIQRRLRSAGFVVSKTRGPVGGKREVLIATKN